MAKLKTEEIRRLVGYLRKLLDEEELLTVEDDLSSEIGEIIIREPEFLAYFPKDLIEC